MTRFTFASMAFTASLLVLLPHAQAQRRIVCDGNYQVTRGGQQLATPYCRDQNLARVARTYGMRVSDDAMRYNESAKADVCRTIGYDLRVREACLPYRNEGGPVFRN